MNFRDKIKINIIFSTTLTFVFLSLFVFVNAEETTYVLLEELPIVGGEVDNFGVYLSNMFLLALQLATVLAVFMISFGGFKYLTEESFTGKSDAKNRIWNAVIGLVILLTSWLLLYTINPDLVQNKFVIPKVETKNDNVSSVVDTREALEGESFDDTNERLGGDQENNSQYNNLPSIFDNTENGGGGGF